MGSQLISPRKKGAHVSRLNPQQQLFVKTLLADPAFNPTIAARTVGYKNPSQASNRLLKMPIIQAAVGKALQERLDDPACSHLTAQRILLELGRIALANPQEMYDDKSEMLPIAKMPERVARSISGIEQDTIYGKDGEVTVRVKVRFWNKNHSLELLAKHAGLLKEVVKVNHGVDGEMKDLLSHLLSIVEKPEEESNVIDAQFIESKALVVQDETK